MENFPQKSFKKGPYLPPKSCNIGEQGGRYVDFCIKVSPKTSGKNGAEGLNSASRIHGGMRGVSGVMGFLMAGLLVVGMGMW